MKPIQIFLVMLAGVLLGPVHAAPAKAIQLKLGEQTAVGDGALQILFKSVINDSRCPRGVECVWAGQAKVLLQLEKKGEKAVEVQLTTPWLSEARPNPSEAAYAGYLIQLKSLAPYPGETNKVDTAVTIVVSEQTDASGPTGPGSSRGTAPAPSAGPQN